MKGIRPALSSSSAATKLFASTSDVPLAAAGAAIAGVGAIAVGMALDFEESFTRISALSNSSAEDIERWKGEVLDLAGETARAPKELADALFFLSSAGLEAAEIMPALEVSAKAAAVGLGETEEVANIVASALNAYADSGLEAIDVTDTLVAAVREGRAEPEEFANALGRILPIASQAGVPLGQKNVMAIDPGVRTGCKVARLDRQGKLLHTETIYPFDSERRRAAAEETIKTLCKSYGTEAVAIGNGTAGRETEAFIRALNLPGEIPLVMVNESGASVYSASEVARKEFPDLDVSIRGAVSIGRRLMDPLAELVKIDPKSIGVGQYQHDVDQKLLKEKLDDVVMSCVNMVGVELNTASKQLLSYVSGLGPKRAEHIVQYRNKQGPFKSREELRKVRSRTPSSAPCSRWSRSRRSAPWATRPSRP